MIRHFCTSSDIRYAARLRVMIESLWRCLPDAEITVLCLDKPIQRWLHNWAGKRVSMVGIKTLEQADDRLAPLRRQRSPWEYYATLKPVFLLHVIRQRAHGELLAFVDSDTCFFSNPQPLADEMGDASIALSPHRFLDHLERLRRYGHYNAGFGIWRHDDSGTRCLRDWADDCIRWCHTRVEEGKFMNQGYLNEWPRRYPKLIELQHPGHNLAPWNLDGHQLTSHSGGLQVDGHPLIFFHFSHLYRNQRREWCILDKWPVLHQPLPRHALFGRYLDALDQAEAAMPWLLRWRASRSLRQPKSSKAHINLSQWCLEEKD